MDAVEPVLRDLLDAAVAEGLLAGPGAPVPGGTLRWASRPGGPLQGSRYDGGPVSFVPSDGSPARSLAPADVLALVAPDAPYLAEVATALGDSEAATRVLGDPGDRRKNTDTGCLRCAIADTGAEVLAAGRGRPFHPTARAVGGWGAAELERYGPGAEVGLRWVAVRRDHLRHGPGPGSATLADAVADAPAAPAGFQVLPVHPFDHAHVLAREFAAEIDDGVVVPLPDVAGSGRATASLRTLALTDHLHLKLPLGVVTLGSTRLLPARYLDNGDRGERTLRAVLAADPDLARRVAVADEGTWAGFAVPDGSPAHPDEFADRPGRLAAQLRRVPDTATPSVPLGALAARPPGALLARVVDAVVAVGIGFLRHGVLPEMHGQNVLVAVEGRPDDPSGPVRLVLRDHDTVRVCPGWLTVPDPEYRTTPGGRQSLRLDDPVDLVGYLQTLALEVALGGVVDAHARATGEPEEQGWAMIGAAVRRALDGLDPGPVRDVLTATLLDAPDWPWRAVLGPLLARGASTGLSMPAATTRVPNPLR